MVILSPYAENVIDNLNLIGMWIAVVVSGRNFSVCYSQFQRTRGKIHLVNMAQVTVLMLHRILYGIIPLFEIKSCPYFPFLVSLWHITYILFYIVMFMRLIILELDRNSRWIKIVSVLLITLRFADWPYELAYHAIEAQRNPTVDQCWAKWGEGVIILNFIGDALATLFLSGMFVRRLFIHINMSKSIISTQNKIIESIARKSLICLALTFVVNLAMNLLKVTYFLGDRSDSFTVYFEIIESTLLVEALRNDSGNKLNPNVLYCGGCQKELVPVSEKSGNNNETQYSSRMFSKTPSHHIEDTERQRFNSTYSEDTFQTEDIIRPVEPTVSSERRKSNPFIYSHDIVPTPLQPRPSPLNDVSFSTRSIDLSKDIMMTSRRSQSPKDF